ncbi:hypothetical protein QJS66_01805 [Kocuria rhizophila]|nr:hypothetical protein QJS66_01805 [Kocuria rhizophila]
MLVYDVAVYDVNLYRATCAGPPSSRWGEGRPRRKARACRCSVDPGRTTDRRDQGPRRRTAGQVRGGGVRGAVRARQARALMRVTVRQPDLLPYSGFWYKMAVSDAFVVSGTTSSRSRATSAVCGCGARGHPTGSVGKPALVPITDVQVMAGWQENLRAGHHEPLPRGCRSGRTGGRPSCPHAGVSRAAPWTRSTCS